MADASDSTAAPCSQPTLRVVALDDARRPPAGEERPGPSDRLYNREIEFHGRTLRAEDLVGEYLDVEVLLRLLDERLLDRSRELNVALREELALVGLLHRAVAEANGKLGELLLQKGGKVGQD